jgi:hypothetical protein
LIYDRSQSRQIFLSALQEAEKFAFFLCPWVTKYSINAEVEALLRQRLAAGIRIGIGYGRAQDVKQGQLQPDYLHNAVPLLEELQIQFITSPVLQPSCDKEASQCYRNETQHNTRQQRFYHVNSPVRKDDLTVSEDLGLWQERTETASERLKQPVRKRLTTPLRLR